jgi:hemerythrin superfamily protein
MAKAKPSDNNAIEELKADHKTVKALFDRFDDDKSEDKQSIMDEAINELKIHATVEEELFYPAVREEAGEDIMNEAEIEHHVARILIAELDKASEDDEDRRSARFKVLAESVRHHIQEEEGEMFPRIEESGIDLDALGERLMERKTELKDEGVPPDSEHKMIAQFDNGESGRQTGPKRERTIATSESVHNRSAAKTKPDESRGLPGAKQTKHAKARKS